MAFAFISALSAVAPNADRRKGRARFPELTDTVDKVAPLSSPQNHVSRTARIRMAIPNATSKRNRIADMPPSGGQPSTLSTVSIQCGQFRTIFVILLFGVPRGGQRISIAQLQIWELAPRQLADANFNKERVMSKRVLKFVLLAAAISLPNVAARAEPSCTTWMWQSDGSYWQQCVNDDGSRHCYSATDSSGSNAREISC